MRKKDFLVVNRLASCASAGVETGGASSVCVRVSVLCTIQSTGKWEMQRGEIGRVGGRRVAQFVFLVRFRWLVEICRRSYSCRKEDDASYSQRVSLCSFHFRGWQLAAGKLYVV